MTFEPSFIAFSSQFSILSHLLQEAKVVFAGTSLWFPCEKHLFFPQNEHFSVYSVYLETCEYSLAEYGFPDGRQPSLGLSLDFVLETKAPLKGS